MSERPDAELEALRQSGNCAVTLERAATGWPIVMPSTSRLPSVLTPTATMMATETI